MGAHREEPSSPHSRAFAPLAIPLVTVGVAIALSGCGGEEELTEEDFVTQGNQICEEGRGQYAELQEDPPRSAAEAAELTEQLIEITEGEIEDLRALNAPDVAQDALDRYLEAREQGLEILRDGLEAAQSEDAGAYADAQAEIAKTQVERAKLAREVGFTECSRPLTADIGGETDASP